MAEGQSRFRYGKVDGAELISALATIGGLLLVATLVASGRLIESRLAIFVTFAFMLSLAPILSAGIVYARTRASGTTEVAWHAGLALTKSLLLALLLLVIFATSAKSRSWPMWAVPWQLAVVTLTIAVATGFRYAKRGPFWTKASTYFDVWLVVAASVAVFLLSPFEPNATMPVGLLSYAFNAPGFGFWLLIGIAWTIFGIWVRWREGWAFPKSKKVLEALAIAGAVLFIVSLYDDSHFVDFGHYSPIVGPAMHATHGGIPMVDVYSQYGLLPWLVQRAVFVVFDPTFGTAAVTQRMINLGYFLVVLLILIGVTRRWLSALWFLVPALLVAITSHNPGPDGMWNMNSLPMTLGGRWLVPATMSLALVYGRGKRWSLRAEMALIVVASLSSIEILAFTLAPWGICRFVDSLRIRSLRCFLTQIAFALAAIICALVSFSLVVYLSTGAMVDYRPYMQMFGQFQPSEASIWSATFVPYYALWFPVGCAYFVVISAATYRALLGEPGETLIERLLPVAALGLGPLAYFFGRPQEATLNIACTTFAIVAIAMAQVVFIKPGRFGAIGLAMCGAFAFAFMFTAADGFEHFMRAFDPARGNATFLRRCLAAEGCSPAQMLRNIDLALHTQTLDDRTSVGYYARGAKRERIEEAISMLRRWASDASRVTMLTDSFSKVYADADSAISMASFMATGQWFAWGVSSATNDSSVAVIRKIVGRAAKAPSGSIVIISNSFLNGKWSDLETTVPEQRALSNQDLDRIAKDATLVGEKFLAALIDRQREDLVPVNQAILVTLTKRCAFKLLERGRYNSVFVTENCSG